MRAEPEETGAASMSADKPDYQKISVKMIMCTLLLHSCNSFLTGERVGAWSGRWKLHQQMRASALDHNF